MDIDSIMVCGAGTMGSGIAQVAAANNVKVILVDVSQESLERGLKTIRVSLDRLVAKNRLAASEGQAAISRIQISTDVGRGQDVPFVIEAVYENLDVKARLLRELDKATSPETILASNTSSISITKLAAHTSRPNRLIGMHFMNPVPLMALVELVRGLATSQETHETTRELALKLKKTPVEVNDSPGFVSNRVLMPMINEAVFSLWEGVGDAKAIDTIMKLGMNHPMGPLTLADFIGLDVCLDIMNVLFDGFKDSKYRPCPLLQKMVDAGYLGRKSGRGFYNYERKS